MRWPMLSQASPKLASPTCGQAGLCSQPPTFSLSPSSSPPIFNFSINQLDSLRHLPTAPLLRDHRAIDNLFSSASLFLFGI